MVTKRRAEHQAGTVGRIMAIAMAVAVASAGAWASGGASGGTGQDRVPTQSRQAVPDNDSVPQAARRSYEDFWKRLPKSKADTLERELNSLESRQRRGEAVERDVEKLRREYPQLFVMSTSLQSVQWIVSNGGATQAATCVGLGWIGRNGRLRCLGRMTT